MMVETVERVESININIQLFEKHNYKILIDII